MKHSVISFPDLERELRSGCEGTSQKACHNAEKDGKLNHPGIDEAIDFYFEEYHHGFSRQIARIYSVLQIPSKCLAVLENTKLYREAHQKLDNDERVIDDRLVDINQMLGRNRRGTSIKSIILGSTLTVCLFDGLFNQPIFEFSGVHYLQSLGCSLLFGGGLFALAHVAVPRIMKASKKDAAGYWTALGIGISTLFTFMSYQRLRVTEGIVSPFHSGVILYTLVSLGMFALACYLSSLYHANKNTLPATTASLTEDLKKEQEKLVQEKKRIIKERKDLIVREQEEKQAARAIFEYAEGLRQEVIESAEQAYFSYKKINRLNREDKMIPICFSDPYPFVFKTFYEMSKEKPPFQPSGTILTFMLGFFLCLFACTPSPDTPHYDTAATVMIDTTDTMQTYPDTLQLDRVLGIPDNPWQGVWMSVACITDMDITGSHMVILPSAQRITGNVYKRKNKVAAFHHELDSVITLCRPKGVGRRDHSIIYRSIVRQVQVLQSVPAEHKYLIIYSDMLEHSDLLNCYDPGTLRKLSNHPEDVQQDMELKVPLPDMIDITIWLVYQPKDYQDNLRYRVLSDFFKDLFEKHRAMVHVVASL